VTIAETELRETLAEATALVARAADVVRARLGGSVAFRRKSDRTLVSEIDLEVEAMLRAELARRFPDDGILGEEEGETGGDARRRWVVDPIDGTRSLRHRIPLFGTLLALQEQVASARGADVALAADRGDAGPGPGELGHDDPDRGDPCHGEPGRDDSWCTLVGVCALPAIGRLYGAARGLGAFRDGERFAQAAVEEGIDEEVISLGERRQFVGAGCPAVFDRLVALHPGARVYPDCFAHALAAEGALGAMVDFDLKPWDLAATQLLVEEAGGRCAVVGERGAGAVVRRDVVLGKPAVVAWVLRAIEAARVL
jgi:fructose-1,6-bisphosphatase/inositol monophosphatase family enzyme